jgi:hypothetical protein
MSSVAGSTYSQYQCRSPLKYHFTLLDRYANTPAGIGYHFYGREMANYNPQGKIKASSNLLDIPS